jgi:type IV pilus assembly protein PilC
MPTFTFTARDGSGLSSNGTLVADTQMAAAQMLRAEGKYPTSLRASESAPSRSFNLPVGRPRLIRKELLQFATQLQIMIETGVTLSEALETITAQSQRELARQVIADLSRHVQRGETFSSALMRYPRSFPRLLVALVAASEKSGLMARLLARAVAYLRDEQETLRRVRGALIYPGIMMAFALSTTCFLMTFVLPKFTAIYASKGAALPALTQMLMSFSGFLIHDWPWLIIALAAIGTALWYYRRTPGGRRVFDKVQLRVPLMGAMFRKLHLARGLRMIGTMAGAGISLPDSVKTAYDLCPNTYFQDLWGQVGTQIQAGKQFSEPLFQSPLVPMAMAQMLQSAEKGGRLAQVMEQVSGFAETELKEQIADMTRYIEPAMIVLMGAIIGTVALALMLPIFTISRVIVK